MKQERLTFVCGGREFQKVAPEDRYAKSVIVLFVDDLQGDVEIDCLKATFTCKNCYIVGPETSADYESFFVTSQHPTKDGFKQVTVAVQGEGNIIGMPLSMFPSRR